MKGFLSLGISEGSWNPDFMLWIVIESEGMSLIHFKLIFVSGIR